MAKVVVGLGNPGSEYAETRHNVGFMVLDELSRRSPATSASKRFRSVLRENRMNGEKVILVAPQTFMNLSGHAVREVMHWYHVPPEEMLVIVDDLNLPFGSLRMRHRGSAGGHNGLASIIEQTGSMEFPRLRLGIGRGGGASRAHVLSRFAPDERTELPGFIDKAADAAELWLRDGSILAMNAINRTVEPAELEVSSPAALEERANNPDD